jgi:peptidoglycan/LPS O-acetylase OafA/YrhL
VATLRTTPLARFFHMTPLRSLGRYSYGIYVYNSIFILVADALFVPARIATWTDSIVIERLLYVASAATVTLTMAWLSWHLVEKHFLKLKVHFESRPAAPVVERPRPSLGQPLSVRRGVLRTAWPFSFKIDGREPA